MNAKKDRYAVRISESSYIEMQEQALRDEAYSIVRECIGCEEE